MNWINFILPNRKTFGEYTVRLATLSTTDDRDYIDVIVEVEIVEETEEICVIKALSVKSSSDELNPLVKTKVLQMIPEKLDKDKIKNRERK